MKPDVAIEQKRKEEREHVEAENANNGNQNGGHGTSTGVDTGAGTGTSSTGTGTNNAGGAQPVINKHFYMSIKLDNTRVNRDINNYVQEIIQHLQAVDGANVELKFEVEVEAPNGIPSTTVRTVSENCRTLHVTDFGFDE